MQTWTVFQEVAYFLRTYMPTPLADGTLEFGGTDDDARAVKKNYMEHELTLHGALRFCLAVPLSVQCTFGVLSYWDQLYSGYMQK